MKKIFKIFAVAAIAIVGLSSCQKKEFAGSVITDKDGAIKTMQLVVNADTRMAFSENADILYRQFEVGDTLVGCVKVDDAYAGFSFKVTDVQDASGSTVYTIEKAAGADGIPAAETTTNLHFFYVPNRTANSVSSTGNLTVSIATQHQAHIPGVLYGSGKFAEGKCNITFNSATEVVVLKDYTVKDVTGAAVSDFAFTNLMVSNVITSGSFSIENDEIVFTPGTEPAAANVKATEAFTGAPIYFAAYANATPAKVKLTACDVMSGVDVIGSPEWETPNAVTMKPNGYGRIAGVSLDVTPEAEFNGTPYATLDAALEAAMDATSDFTVKLLKDVNTTSGYEFLNNMFKKMTFDFNDHIVRSAGVSNTFILASDVDFVDGPNGTGGITSSQRAIIVQSEGVTLNINAGTYRGATDYGTIRFYGSESVLNVGGTAHVIATGSGNRAINMGIDVAASAATAVFSGDCVIESEFEALKNQYGKSTINGGTFVGYKALASNASNGGQSITVNDGYFYATGDTIVWGAGFAGKLNGGYYNIKPFDGYTGEGLKYKDITASPVVKDGRTYNFTTEKDETAAATIGSTPYNTFADAWAVADMSTTPCTITLAKDCIADTLTLNNENRVTLELNGFALTTSLCVYGDLAIQDSSAEGTGSVKLGGSGQTLIRVEAGAKLYLKNGTYYGCMSSNDYRGCIYTQGESGNKCEVTIDGGTYTTSSQAGCVLAYNANVTINDGKFTATGTYGRALVTKANGTITVNDGEFSGTNTAWRNQAISGRLTINGGRFHTNHETNGVLYISSTCPNLTINGGYFVSENTPVFTGAKIGDSSIHLKGGKFNKLGDNITPETGYKWQEMGTPDTTTMPGFTLKYEVVAE